MNRSASILAVSALSFAWLVGCSAKKPAPTGPATVEAAASPVMTLKELQNGDRACYVVMTDEAGAETSIEGEFELCAGGEHDATALIGQRVTYTTKKANVLAASCEGDMDCGKSDEVDLVITLVAAP